MQLLYLVIAVCAFAMPLYFISFYRRHQNGKNRHVPFKDKLLRSPGQSISDQIRELSENLIFYFFSVTIIPMFFTSIIFILHSQKIISRRYTLLAGGIFLLLEIYYFWKSRKGLNKRRLLRLEYDGEVAVGQELNLLMFDGYHVFHDLVTDDIKNFNIDHIVVGSSGVYTVETKTRLKTRRGADSGEINYNGRHIEFPEGNDSSPIDQAIRQAAWLHKWLVSAVGEKVNVEPIVTLPGWYINRTAKNGIAVLNPKMIRDYIKNNKVKPLPEKMVLKIVHQIDRKCRDTDPVMAEMQSEAGKAEDRC
jgi:hypothetical protein